eukprot:gb/GEZN01005773.1/.p1 GENE.gb/GEZN01005773.1/~~gb/GEZN01005773.1/.p1  ORF type:complete len:577 (-),score=62.74 gb/GEZN01005773.1/:24-1592(-)
MVRSVDGVQFFLELWVGTPAQQLSHMIFDTGSPSLLLFSRDYCLANQPPPRPDQPPDERRTCYSVEASSSAMPPGGTPTDKNYQAVLDQDFVRSGQGRQLTDQIAFQVWVAGLDSFSSPSTPNQTLPTQAPTQAPSQGTTDNKGDGLPTDLSAASSLWKTDANILVASDMYVVSGGHTREGSARDIFHFADGIIGSGYNWHDSSSSPWLLLTQRVAETPLHLFMGLDYQRDAKQTSKLYLGGIPEHVRLSLQWSHAPGSAGIVSAQADSGVSLLGGSSSLSQPSGGLPAIIDTAASCLTLPMELFDAVVSWLPIWCAWSIQAEIYSVEECAVLLESTKFYYDQMQPEIFPTLSFQLSPQGEVLYLPLHYLLLPVSTPAVNPNIKQTPGKPLCLVRGRSLQSDARVYFGAMALSPFFVSLAMPTHQVGLANKAAFSPSFSQCKPKLTCMGMQVHNPDYNVCVDPPCLTFYFYSFSSVDKMCVLRPSFHVTAVFFIVLLIVVEMSMNEVYLRLQHKVISTIDVS